MSRVQNIEASVGEDNSLSNRLQLLNLYCDLMERANHLIMIASRCAPPWAPTHSRCGVPSGLDAIFGFGAETGIRDISNRSADSIYALLTGKYAAGAGACRAWTGCEPGHYVARFDGACRRRIRGIRD